MDRITVEELAGLPSGTTIINAGDHAGRREIRGALRYRPSDLLEADHLALPIAHDATIVLYDEHGWSEKLHRIAERLRADGFTDVRILDADLAAFEAAGGAFQEPSMEQVVPPATPAEVQKLDRRI